IRVLFDAGGVTPSESGLAELRALAKRLAGDETAGIVLSHELGREDEAIVRARKNPPLEDALALAARLRDHKRAILDERTDRKSEARAAFATGRDEAAAAARERLRALDRELVATEAALDDVLEVARRDAPRYAERRTRDGCVALARQRLEEVRRALLAAGAPAGEDRIRVRSPRYDAPERDGGGAVRIDAVVVVAAE